MIKFYFILFSLLCLNLNAQSVEDDFEGIGTITTWFGDDCEMDSSANNPYQQGVNVSNTVLEYNDIGGQYGNVRFDVSTNFDLTIKNSFSLKIYVPSGGITGNQTNQISLKLQDGTLSEPWTTQSEIIKPILLDQWQEVIFNFETDNYINLDVGSVPPIQRTDFNRVVLQINGENNTDLVLAYIDDILHLDVVSNDPVYDYLVWSDEFDGNGAINSLKWFHQTQLPNGDSWYNGEVQHYTNREDNSSVSEGVLNLVAKKETYTDQNVTKQYTSARLNSKFAFTYGKVEIRAKLPSGVGTWPAIWMLGKNINEYGAYWDNEGFDTTSWPACGEVDIMEHWGHNQNYVQSAMHTPSSYGCTFNVGGQTVSTASSAFHVYSLEWSPEKMVFAIDGNVHYTYNPEVKDANTWPFDAEQYLLLNFAIQSNIETGFTQDAMVVDYVRVYQESPLYVDDFESTELMFFYPNPVKDVLNITSQQFPNSNATLQIVDLSGRLVSESQCQFINGKMNFDVSSLSDGVYFLSLSFENIITDTFKFIKQ
ncbi:family 16 glycosylhydrolase [Winogradskyella thalassocola]|uniref:Por secretion system C-terminal sorting domain-containing protein n=1 Tax=Winogradskyella thalassocola TaxID=262004 RepID=A0A1G8L1Z1_9FLAO|nr:family 16 glycosylhydrolase [Winogradskyella thalassocola]SDI49702.1 Por secretion system C-terminal sorting domain-containing protein [Winogradskyella thalassocola]